MYQKHPMKCKYCGKELHEENGILVDNETGGDVCGWNGGNEPHISENTNPIYLSDDKDLVIIIG